MPPVSGHPAAALQSHRAENLGEHFISQVSLTAFLQHMAREFNSQYEQCRDNDGDPLEMAGFGVASRLCGQLAESLTLFALDDFKDTKVWTQNP